jgi:hypothetical protein
VAQSIRISSTLAASARAATNGTRATAPKARRVIRDVTGFSEGFALKRAKPSAIARGVQAKIKFISTMARLQNNPL